MFVDASALVAIILNEPEGAEFNVKIEKASQKWVCGLGVFETVLALMRAKNDSYEILLEIVEAFVKRHGIQFIDIDADVARGAVAAFGQYGKGRHKAKLNMSDCFSYACAKKIKQPILFKGNDFNQTDIKCA